MKLTHNINKFDYYCFVALSYLGVWGGIVAILAGIWFSDYRWKLVFTGLFLFFLNSMAEAGIREYKKSR